MQHYFINRGNQKYGPYTIDELSQQKLIETDKVWTQGNKEWLSISQFPELNGYIIKTPQKKGNGGSRKKIFTLTAIILTTFMWFLRAINKKDNSLDQTNQNHVLADSPLLNTSATPDTGIIANSLLDSNVKKFKNVGEDTQINLSNVQTANIPDQLTDTNYFKQVYGSKAKYMLKIPKGFSEKDPINANCDLIFGNADGASIVTVVKDLYVNTNDDQISEFDRTPISELKTQLEATGMENVTIQNKGLVTINNRTTFFMYYTTSNESFFYCQNINQFRNGKFLSLTLNCPNNFKNYYLPYFEKIINSLN